MEVEITKDFFLPAEYREDFYVEKLEEYPNEYRLIVIERKEMKQRIKLLFEALPDLKEAYKIVTIFRGIYSLKNFGEQTYNRARKALHKWYATIGNINIIEIKNLAHSIKRYEPQMLAFFFEGYTNAFAESLNSKLQRLIQNNYGIRNQDLFLFRVNKIFT